MVTGPPPTPPASGRGVRAAIADAAARIASATSRLDAELLMAHALGVSHQDLLLKHLGDPEPDGFAGLVERRLGHEPVAYITGSRGFWTVEIGVGPGVLVPRADSETLIEAAVAHFAGTSGPKRVLDLGTGPGTLLLAALAEWPEAHGLGIDASERALQYAQDNAIDLGMDERARFKLGDWSEGLAGQFDLILCNPPYIGTAEELGPEVRDHEPPAALFAGADGLDDYRRIVPDLPRLLAPGGIAVIEIGWTQADPVSALMRAAGLDPILHHDLGGRPRAVAAKMPRS
ncbi:MULTISPECIES: peptide chain release factor N(5)-glutamine methyltransferase [unclassified Sphingomonas]|uniref:peptide chain release factor N(5)-glutamine methyltransferase n=1 Tax=unclassified Sphingomonas TaxID=196159 RepID=UPI0021519671|nr:MULTISPECIES: peptide chain release factor N(5)-glutamine methyltransferase [unclassified Sphingomonas]MCR5870129.1 peptide chain release factor N(5)-glutamine methyltransferase [Sphingomonas sp. J344]UUX98181.1 peptide chain release factor N(5)-glutamine methyltransferase [Sphingomonas sp. J315]